VLNSTETEIEKIVMYSSIIVNKME
jgi:hypothetical protein